MTTEPMIVVKREIPISLRLVEAEVDGKRGWLVYYVAEVDGETIGHPITRPLIGGMTSTPLDALKLAAERNAGIFGL